MTISSEAIKSSVFAGNGSTTAFAISYKVFNQSDLTVTLTSSAGVEEVKTLTTNYTVSLNANQDNSPGGTVTMGVAPASGEKLVIANEPAYTQSSDIVNGGGFFPNVIEDMVDRNTILSRRAQELTSRSIQIPISDSTGTTVKLPTETLRASKAIVFDSSGHVGVSVDNYIDQTTASASSASAAAASALAASSSASAVAFPFTFSTTTTMSDPGSGVVRVNNSSLASVSAIAFDALSADTGSPDISDFIVTWDDSTSTINGHLIIVEEGTPANFAVFAVGSVTDNSGWLQVAVTYVDGGSSLFTNATKVRCNFTRVGDKGDTGSTGSTGPTGSSAAGLHYQFETTTTDADQGAGKLWLNNAVASATILYIDDDDNDGVNVSAFTATWDDSTHTALRGYIRFQARSTATDWALFSITGATVDATAYQKFAVTHVASTGTFSDTEVIDVFFTRTGDDGSINNVVEDTSPQLGASLDVQGFGLTSSSTIMNPTLTSTGKALVLGF